MDLIRWNEPRFDEKDEKAVLEVLRNNYVNEGPKTRELEEKLQRYLKVKHVIMVSNCTAALFLAIKADAIIKGVKDFEVIVPDMTMIATASAVGLAGGRTVSVDVEKERFTIDPLKIEEKITKKTTAIVPVHIIGRASNLDALKHIADKHGLAIIEDVAGAFGSMYNENHLGTIGKVGCFSLQSNKIITCGQGGFVTTNDDNYFATMRRIRDFGRLNNQEFLHLAEGYNFKFSDLSAALALSQLNKIESRKDLLVRQRELYELLLSDVKEIVFPSLHKKSEIPLWIDVMVERRDELVTYLKGLNIIARPYWPAIHRNPPYSYCGTDEHFLVASEIADRGLWLPNGPSINEEQIKIVCEKIKEFYG